MLLLPAGKFRPQLHDASRCRGRASRGSWVSSCWCYHCLGRFYSPGRHRKPADRLLPHPRRKPSEGQEAPQDSQGRARGRRAKVRSAAVKSPANGLGERRTCPEGGGTGWAAPRLGVPSGLHQRVTRGCGQQAGQLQSAPAGTGGGHGDSQQAAAAARRPPCPALPSPPFSPRLPPT